MHLQCGQPLLTETMRCNKNLSHLHQERTYSLTEQIDDACVAFMHYKRQQYDLTLRSCRLCCLTLLDSLKMNVLFIKESICLASMFPNIYLHLWLLYFHRDLKFVPGLEWHTLLGLVLPHNEVRLKWPKRFCTSVNWVRSKLT